MSVRHELLGVFTFFTSLSALFHGVPSAGGETAVTVGSARYSRYCRAVMSETTTNRASARTSVVPTVGVRMSAGAHAAQRGRTNCHRGVSTGRYAHTDSRSPALTRVPQPLQCTWSEDSPTRSPVSVCPSAATTANSVLDPSASATWRPRVVSIGLITNHPISVASVHVFMKRARARRLRRHPRIRHRDRPVPCQIHISLQMQTGVKALLVHVRYRPSKANTHEFRLIENVLGGEH